MSKNGQARRPSLFCVIADRTGLMSYEGVIQFLEANATEQAKTNLAMGPIFRDLCDEFREWSKYAEQTWLDKGDGRGRRLIPWSIRIYRFDHAEQDEKGARWAALEDDEREALRQAGRGLASELPTR